MRALIFAAGLVLLAAAAVSATAPQQDSARCITVQACGPACAPCVAPRNGTAVCRLDRATGVRRCVGRCPKGFAVSKNGKRCEARGLGLLPNKPAIQSPPDPQQLLGTYAGLFERAKTVQDMGGRGSGRGGTGGRKKGELVTAVCGEEASATLCADYYDVLLLTLLPPAYSSNATSDTLGGHAFISPAQNQGSCGSCVGFALTAAGEAAVNAHMLQDWPALGLSEQDASFCRLLDPVDCRSGTTYDSVVISVNAGRMDAWASRSCLAYRAGSVNFAWYLTDGPDAPCKSALPPGHRFSIAPASNIARVQHQILLNGGVLTSLTISDDFLAFYPPSPDTVFAPLAGAASNSTPTLHAVFCYGWDDARLFFRCKNSWGESWGDRGSLNIAYGAAGVMQPDATFGLRFAHRPGAPEQADQLAATLAEFARGLRPDPNDTACALYTPSAPTRLVHVHAQLVFVVEATQAAISTDAILEELVAANVDALGDALPSPVSGDIRLCGDARSLLPTPDPSPPPTQAPCGVRCPAGPCQLRGSCSLGSGCAPATTAADARACNVVFAGAGPLGQVARGTCLAGVCAARGPIKTSGSPTKCLAPLSPERDAFIEAQDCSASNENQRLQYLSDGSLKFTGYTTCMGLTSDCTTGAQIRAWTCAGTALQRWFRDGGRLRPACNPGLCLQYERTESRFYVLACTAGNIKQQFDVSFMPAGLACGSNVCMPETPCQTSGCSGASCTVPTNKPDGTACAVPELGVPGFCTTGQCTPGLVTSLGDYVGCFREPGSTCQQGVNTSPFFTFLGQTTANTVEACLTLAKAGGFRFAGLQNGTSCFGGNSLERYGIEFDACRSTCAGKPTQICGGACVASLYYAGVSTAAPPLYLGCFPELVCTGGASDRVWPLLSAGPGTTVDVCQELAVTKGLRFVGLQNGNECRGGQSPFKFTASAMRALIFAAGLVLLAAAAVSATAPQQDSARCITVQACGPACAPCVAPRNGMAVCRPDRATGAHRCVGRCPKGFAASKDGKRCTLPRGPIQTAGSPTKCLAPLSPERDAFIEAQDCSASNENQRLQYWTDGSLKFTGLTTCLGVTSECTAGAQIRGWTCAGTALQRWFRDGGRLRPACDASLCLQYERTESRFYVQPCTAGNIKQQFNASFMPAGLACGSNVCMPETPCQTSGCSGASCTVPTNKPDGTTCAVPESGVPGFCTTGQCTPGLVTSLGDYVGCFREPGSTCQQGVNTSPFFTFLGQTTANTVEACLTLAKAGGFRFAGLQNGTSCFGGNSLEPYGVELGACKSLCAGNSAQICGGACVASLYYAGVSTAAPPLYLGCFPELVCTGGASDRVWPLLSYGPETTLDACREQAVTAGLRFVGLQNGNECRGGQSPFKFTARYPVSGAKCESPCPGNGSQMCGGSCTTSVYAVA
ncbi:Wscd1 [Scenedesmus sp. PABB004]|nr:Wscd1 [Scenedesmus sp. PABB004]